MIRFDSPIYIWLLLIIPVMTLLMMSAEWQRVKNMKKLGDRNLIQELMPDASKTRRWVKFIFVQMILAIVILMLARPQIPGPEGKRA